MKTWTKYLLPTLACVLMAAGQSTRASNDVREMSSNTSSAANSAVRPAARGPRSVNARERETWVMGNIIAVKKNSLALNTENGRMRTLKLNHGTDIMVDGKKAAVSDLQAGAVVMASYEGSGTHATATRVQVEETGHPNHAPAKATGLSSTQAFGGQTRSSSHGK